MITACMDDWSAHVGVNGRSVNTKPPVRAIQLALLAVRLFYPEKIWYIRGPRGVTKRVITGARCCHGCEIR